LVPIETRRPNNMYILEKEKRKKIEVTQKISKDHNNERKENKIEKKEEVLLSSTCSGGSIPKETSHPLPLMSKGERKIRSMMTWGE